MSAYQVNPLHIGAIVKFYLEDRGCKNNWRGHRVNHNDAAEIMACLAEENARSVNARYPSHDPAEPMVCEDRLDLYAVLTPVQILKACACLEYQSCETEDWEKTEAHGLLEQIRYTAIHALEGYEDADWEVGYARNQQAARELARHVERKKRIADAAAYMRAYCD